MKRLLFVDDEVLVLEGLRDLLHRYRRKWEMVFAHGGQAALDELARGHFDVVVTDLRMPGVDGPAVLREVQARYPHMVRIVLSGHAELESTLRALPVAHQFLAKPASAQTLEDAVDRACNLQELIGGTHVHGLVGKIHRLPSSPRVYAQLRRVLANERFGVREVAEVIEQDAGMCAKVLQLVNSAFFGHGRQITSVESAVSYLGCNMIVNLAMAAEVFEPWRQPKVEGFSLEALQRHASFVSNLAPRLLEGRGRPAEDAFMAGMLHDVGILVLALELPALLQAALDRARRERRPLWEIEEELYGVTHAEVGAHLLGLWGLPYPVIEAVAYHHAPRKLPPRGMDTVAAVHFADALAHEQDPSSHEVEMPLDEECLAALGCTEKLDQWRASARKAWAATGETALEAPGRPA